MLTKINFVVEAAENGAEPFTFVTRVPSGETLHIKGQPVNLIDLHTTSDKQSLENNGFELVKSDFDIDPTSSVGWEEAYTEHMVQ
jgi:hypothetical protein